MGSVNISSKNNQATHLVNYSIYLPFPTVIQVGTNYIWESQEMGVGADLVGMFNQGTPSKEDLTALVERTGSQMLASLGGSASQRAFKDRRIALNPKEEMLFKGVDFRQFSLTWELMPTSAQESQAYADAIEKMHEMAAPALIDNGTFFEYPKTTSVIVKKAGGREIINRPDSAITNINVDLTPDGIWSQLKDGRPVHTRLTIEFKELTLPTKDNVPKLLG